ncbi:MAG: hypothetical protein ACD_3C00242G0005, partial [uncultured bacterium (gcode 4)]
MAGNVGFGPSGAAAYQKANRCLLKTVIAILHYYSNPTTKKSWNWFLSFNS